MPTAHAQLEGYDASVNLVCGMQSLECAALETRQLSRRHPEETYTHPPSLGLSRPTPHNPDEAPDARTNGAVSMNAPNRSGANTRTGAHVFAEALKRHGVEVIF